MIAKSRCMIFSSPCIFASVVCDIVTNMNMHTRMNVDLYRHSPNGSLLSFCASVLQLAPSFNWSSGCQSVLRSLVFIGACGYYVLCYLLYVMLSYILY